MSRTRHGPATPSSPESGIQVRPFAVGFTTNFRFPASRSEWHGLIYASAGVMSVHNRERLVGGATAPGGVGSSRHGAPY